MSISIVANPVKPLNGPGLYQFFRLLAVANIKIHSALVPPIPTFSRIVIEGDSITSTTPYQTDNHSGFYSHTWADEHPALTCLVSAQGSRVMGGAAYNGDLANNNANSLLAKVSEDLGNPLDLLTAMIGVNDLSSTGCQVPTYLQRLRDWAALIRAGVMR